MSCPRASFASAFSVFSPTGGGPPCCPFAVKCSRSSRCYLLCARPHPSHQPHGLVHAVVDPWLSSRGSVQSRFGLAPWTCGVSLIRPDGDSLSDLRRASARRIEVCPPFEKLTPRALLSPAVTYSNHLLGSPLSCTTPATAQSRTRRTHPNGIQIP